MDGAEKQQEMGKKLKREMKENAHQRRWERLIKRFDGRLSITEAPASDQLPQHLRVLQTTSTLDVPLSHTEAHDSEMEPCPERRTGCILVQNSAERGLSSGRSDTILLMFYLDYLLPFLYPFYQPSILQGGRAWILEMTTTSPVIQQATLCQSSYFFSLTQGSSDCDAPFEAVLAKTRDAFEMMRKSIQYIGDSDITEHLHGAARIMTSIMQLHRFEVAVLSFSNYQIHLNAALALFRQILETASPAELAGPHSKFNAVLSRLGPPAWIFPSQEIHVPSAEQAAFQFSSTLLILDDIIASTVLQEEPKLYEYHRYLLEGTDDIAPLINLKATVGCENWALLEIGEVAALDAWKQRCQRIGNLDVICLVQRATKIKQSLEAHLIRVDTNRDTSRMKEENFLDVLTAYNQASTSSVNQNSWITRLWAHSAILYLSIVVSGWQPASSDVRYHVKEIMTLLTNHTSPPALLRTVVWPFCVAGCLAEPAQQPHLRAMVQSLQPSSVFGTIRTALDIMENAWCNRNVGDVTSRDLAMCFRSLGHMVLLV
ncbi:hypothetical protein N7510_009475 [Penicillium lagena]|uniref:uncharacterized protein n=1 Tax=Penicillium lagena TaxID=94218 RepID=UPI002541C6CE|nr:uncharacterized protein N7510_009475 [Penicillium lagena]KAJ5606694.1 hypothetical protein N7510_009475 [Penicillium lagena]